MRLGRAAWKLSSYAPKRFLALAIAPCCPIWSPWRGAGGLPQIGNGRNLVDLTYVENVAHALTLALEAPAACGRTYHITNDEHLLLWDVIRYVLSRLGLHLRRRRLPLPAALLAATLMEAQAQINGRPPRLTRYTVGILARTQTYDIAAARADLGYRPLVAVAAGIEQTLRLWREA